VDNIFCPSRRPSAKIFVREFYLLFASAYKFNQFLKIFRNFHDNSSSSSSSSSSSITAKQRFVAPAWSRATVDAPLFAVRKRLEKKTKMINQYKKKKNKIK
jgi:hypothetical protein